MNSSQPEMLRATLAIVTPPCESVQPLVKLLAVQGFVACVIPDVQAAVDLTRKHPPDLFCVPAFVHGLDAYQVCQQIRQNAVTANISILLIADAAVELDRAKVFQSGAADYLSYPLNTEEAIARIKLHLELQQARRQIHVQAQRLSREIRERQAAEARYLNLFEHAVDGMCQTTPDGRYLSANMALARMLGYHSPQELIEQLTNIGKQLYVQPERRAEFLAYMRAYSEVSDFESQVYRKDGSIIWISENVRQVKDGNDQILYFEETVQDITERKQTENELRYQRKMAERLLLNVLPQRIAERLKRERDKIADNFAEVTVLFADIVDFTSLADRLSPAELVDILNKIFSAFDRLAEKHHLEKIKTIGDAYMIAGGMPIPRPDHAEAIADMALEMRDIICTFTRDDGQPFSLRVGINTGPVVGGVIGIKKFIYDLWGDTVNVASRMETQGKPGGIQVTQATYLHIKDKYFFDDRGLIPVKGKGDMRTYWLLDKKTPLKKPDLDDQNIVE